MKTISRAYDMLKRNRKESWAYLLTLTLSASLLLVFINLQNDTNFLSQITDIKNPILRFSCLVALGGVTFIIVSVCALNCYIANTYFLKAKSQELCVYLSSGMNILTLTKHLLLQNFMILLAALPIGILIACIMNPLVNLIIYNVLNLSGSIFTISWQGIIMWILVLCLEIFYLFLINIGYAYKAELKHLLDENSIVRIPDVRIIKTPVLLYPILLVLSFVVLLFCPVDLNYYTSCLMFSVIGWKGYFQLYMPKQREKNMLQHKHLQSEKLLLSGNITAMIKSCYLYIVMIFFFVVGMICLMVDGLLLPYVQIILAVAYVLLLLLMGASLFFKVMLEANKRKQEFAQLALLGMPTMDRIPILRKEIRILITYCIICPLPFALFISYQFVQTAQMELGMAIFIISSYLLILLFVGVISTLYFEKSAIDKRGEEHE